MEVMGSNNQAKFDNVIIDDAGENAEFISKVADKSGNG